MTTPLAVEYDVNFICTTQIIFSFSHHKAQRFYSSVFFTTRIAPIVVPEFVGGILTEPLGANYQVSMVAEEGIEPPTFWL